MANRTVSASFVTDVLATAGRLEKDDLSATLDKLSQRISEVKVELYDALQKKYGDFYPNLNTALELQSRVEHLSGEMQALSAKIDGEIKSQLNISTAEFEDLAEQLEESRIVLCLLEKLMNINGALQTMESSLKAQDFISSVASLEQMDKWLNTCVHEREGEIKALTFLQDQCDLQRQNLEQSLGEAWSAAVKWTEPQDTLNGPTEIKIELSIATGKKSKDILAKAVQALHRLGLLEPKIKLLGERFFKKMLQPVVNHQGAKVSQTTEMNATAVSVTYSTGKHTAGDSAVPPHDVFTKLTELLTFLQKNLLGLTIQDTQGTDKTNQEHASDSLPLMEMFGDIISPKCLEYTIEHCLAHSVPTSNRDLEGYTSVITCINAFQASIAELGFIKTDNNTLTNFSGSINVLFANKKTQEVLEKARTLMTSEIHNTVKISNDRPFGELKPLGLDGSSTKKAKSAETIVLSSGAKLSANTFRLPDCLISQYVQSLMQLSYETLHEATTSKPQSAIQLFYAVRYMFELFCNVVPTFHKDKLAQLPQLAAVHHNDCMYLAHHLLTLGHQFRGRLPDPLAQGAATFVDLVPKLRRLGTQCFMNQMVQQKEQLLEYLKSAQGFSGLSEDENQRRGQQAVRQAMHQLQHVSKVWYPVLPTNVYCKSVGTLLNSVVEEIVTSITSLEDVSEDDGTQLHALLQLLTDKSPQLYTEAAAVCDTTPTAMLLKHVAKWNKMKELQRLLNASLHEIADRWAEGKGPLAHEFRANEVKQMIRALFQNTDRRSNVLAKIH